MVEDIYMLHCDVRNTTLYSSIWHIGLKIQAITAPVSSRTSLVQYSQFIWQFRYIRLFQVVTEWNQLLVGKHIGASTL